MDIGTSIALAIAAPLGGAVVAPLVQRLTRPFAGWILALVPAGLFLFFVSLLEQVSTSGDALAGGIVWVPALGLDLTFYVDGLSLTFALAISGVGTLIVLYAGAYLKGHPHLGRFFLFLMVFTAAMLGLVLADNTVALFMFWELTAVASFLLIGFDHTRQAARRAAIQALVVTNLGGLALLVGIIAIHQVSGSWELSGLRAAGDILRDHPAYGFVLACMLLAAFTKSAQVPFHFWLPNAMEAPTPVSAYLHSATMVQAGVYLLARMSPTLGDTAIWTAILVTLGGATMIWGALAALRQTDLKLMLAHTTVASLGLMILLIGVGTDAALAGMVIYFVAHALYKAGLFMVVGAVDHETGTRDVTALSGLADRMPITFIAAALAALSMIGLPPAIGFFAKEEMYLDFSADLAGLLILAMLIIGNALLAAVGAIVAIKPFLGAETSTPKRGLEAPLAMLVGPIVLGAGAIVLALLVDLFSSAILQPTVSAVAGESFTHQLSWLVDFTKPAIWLSVATWALAFVVYRYASAVRTTLRRLNSSLRWSADTVFDTAMFGLIRFSGWLTRMLHHGRLELYMVLVFCALAITLLTPILGMGGFDLLRPSADLGRWPSGLALPDAQLHEWAIVLLALVGLLMVLVAPSRLIAILALGIQGAAAALVFLLFGAPDLAFTQFMVEILSVVILALVMARLRLDERDHRPFEDLARDGTLALICGAGVSILLLIVLAGPLDTRLSDLFTATSVPIAHGANIVNVILVDYRGFDTLGEISVVLGAGIAIMVLLRGRARRTTPKAEVEQR